jgi:O-antigen/teichoic acid export membrane protein
VGVILVGILGGPWLIQALAGRDFGFARGLLAILSIGVALDLSGFALEPLLVAHGRAGQVLRIRIAGALLFGALLVALLPAFDAVAAAIATVAASLLMRVWLGRSAARLERS